MLPLFLLAMAAAAAPADVPPAMTGVEAAGLRQLLTIRKVYVDRLTGGRCV